MCEFTVILDNGAEKKQVAKNVIKVKMKGGKAILMDSSSGVTKVDAGSIIMVDTIMAELVLGPGQQSHTSSSVNLNDLELEGLKRFHGHLGPYVVLGFMMGQMARAAYPKKIFSTVFSGTQRPRSCLADGVQYSSCCTVGKNNIAIVESNEARAMFTDGVDAMEISVKPRILSRIDKEMCHENEEALSYELYQTSNDTLFSSRQVKPTDSGKK